jgi:hypothetical protein
MSLAPLRLAAARWALGLLSAEDCKQVAGHLLDRNVYSHALGALWCLDYPTLPEAGPLLLVALSEFGVPVPTLEEAVLILAVPYLEDIAEGVKPPAAALRALADAVYNHYLPTGELVHTVLRSTELWRLTSEYDYIREWYDSYQPEVQERLTDRDRQAEGLATRLLDEQGRQRIIPDWLRWNGGIVGHLATEIAEQRAFDRLPILADALEEAGCTDDAIVEHLRQPRRHRRLCWVVDCLVAAAEQR